MLRSQRYRRWRGAREERYRHREASARPREDASVLDSSPDPQGDAPAAAAPAGWRTVLAIAVASAAMQTVAWVVLYVLFGVAHLGYGFFELSDVAVTYHDYALRVAQGLVPIRDFFIEYPPLFVPLLLAAGNPEPLSAFVERFAALMLGFMLAAGALTALTSATSRDARRPYVTAAVLSACVLALGPIAANRYDAVVAFVIALALLLSVRGRFATAGIVLGLGFALKITPALLLPLVLILAPPRRALVALAGFAVAAVAPFALFLASGNNSARSFQRLLEYHLDRPLEVESISASTLWIGRLAGGVPLRVGNASGSQVIFSAPAEALAQASVYVLVAVLLATLALVWRRRATITADPTFVGLAALAILLAGLVGSKVLSPQYMVWLLPVIPLVALDRRLLGGLLGAALLLTQIEFPANYWGFVFHQSPGPIAIVLARNVLLVAAFGLSLWHLWRLPATEPRVL
jgi:hypothetical protein